MPAPGKMGRHPYIHTLNTMRRAILIAQNLDILGPAPSTSPGYSSLVDKMVGGDWSMLGNDQYGDCTCADRGHRLMLWTAQGSGKIVIPTTAQVLAFYSQATGFIATDPSTDNGADMATIAKDADVMPMCGHVEDGYGMIDPANTDHWKWAICVFGCIPFGINLQQAQMDQFDNGQEWDYVAGSPTIGGHDVLGVEYQPDGSGQIITWGKRWPVTAAFLDPANGILSEVVPVVSHDFVQPSGIAPSGVNLAAMLADLKSLN